MGILLEIMNCLYHICALLPCVNSKAMFGCYVKFVFCCHILIHPIPLICDVDITMMIEFPVLHTVQLVLIGIHSLCCKFQGDTPTCVCWFMSSKYPCFFPPVNVNLWLVRYITNQFQRILPNDRLHTNSSTNSSQDHIISPLLWSVL